MVNDDGTDSAGESALWVVYLHFSTSKRGGAGSFGESGLLFGKGRGWSCCLSTYLCRSLTMVRWS